MLQPLETYSVDHQHYTNCDTITSTNCMSTPFSVKDILNLNMNEEYITSDQYVQKEQFIFEDNYHHWDQNVQYQNYEPHYYYNEQMNTNCVKTEGYDEYMTSHVQQLSNFCLPYPDDKTNLPESTTSEVDSLSKLNIFSRVYSYL